MELDMKGSGAICAKRCGEYRSSRKKGKGQILDEILASAGGNRDYWATKLRGYNRVVFAEVDGKPVKYVAKDRKKGEKHAGGRHKVYKDDFVKVFDAIWADFGMRCPERLLPDIREMIDFLCADEEYGITEEIRAQLLTVSISQAKRYVAAAKKKLAVISGISTTKAPKLNLRAQVPVCTYQERAKTKPGNFAADTVAHCGGSASGSFCKTLTCHDVYSGWLEARALPNAAEIWVKKAAEGIKAGLPFPMLGIHNDNGAEFINKDFIQWCVTVFIKQTRSRPYKKNDNALAEQVNYDAVRKTVGYFRFETTEEYNALAEVYKYLCPLYNYWFHSAKLIGKEQQPNGRIKKIYEKELKTPYQRLLESPDISNDCKTELRRRKSEQNPVELNRKLNDAVEKLVQIHEAKEKSVLTVAGDGQNA